MFNFCSTPTTTVIHKHWTFPSIFTSKYLYEQYKVVDHRHAAVPRNTKVRRLIWPGIPSNTDSCSCARAWMEAAATQITKSTHKTRDTCPITQRKAAARLFYLFLLFEKNRMIIISNFWGNCRGSWRDFAICGVGFVENMSKGVLMFWWRSALQEDKA